jgi:protein SCO1
VKACSRFFDVHRWSLAIGLLLLASVALAVRLARPADHQASHAAAYTHEHPHDDGGVLEQTLVRSGPGPELHFSGLLTSDGKPLPADSLRGRWSIVSLGFTGCSDVCPMTLQLLGEFAADARSGVGQRAVQILFVTVDPENDSPERIGSYLQAFDPRIRGITGSRAAIDAFVAELGGGFRATAAGIDHSTTLFVLDPAGRPAGLLLHPGDSRRLLSDLSALRTPRP